MNKFICLIFSLIFSVIFYSQSWAYSLPNGTSESYNKDVAEFLTEDNIILFPSEWKKIFLKEGTNVPKNRFIAFYFDRGQGRIIKHNKIVEYPAVSIGHEEPYGISGWRFGAYWIGTFQFDMPTTIFANIRQGDAQQILIDNSPLIKKGSKERVFPIHLDKGRHTIEVLFLNRLKFPTFLVTFTPKQVNTDTQLLQKNLSSVKDAVVYYCGVYDSDNFDKSIEITLAESEKPIILFLASDLQVVWKFSNFRKSNLHSVILTSNWNGSMVENLPQGVNLYYYKDIPIFSYFEPLKRNTGSLAQSVKSDVIQALRFFTGKMPMGFSGTMTPKSINIPEIVLNEQLYSQYQSDLKKRINSSPNPYNIGVLQCTQNETDPLLQKKCILSLLRYTDDNLNRRYIELKNLYTPGIFKPWHKKRDIRSGELEDLIKSQRAWLDFRNSLCKISRQFSQNEGWLAEVAESQEFSSCILDETEKRLEILNEKKHDIKLPQPEE